MFFNLIYLIFIYYLYLFILGHYSVLYSRLTRLRLMLLSYQFKIKLAGFQLNCAFYGKSLTYPPDGSSRRKHCRRLESRQSLKFDFR